MAKTVNETIADAIVRRNVYLLRLATKHSGIILKHIDGTTDQLAGMIARQAKLINLAKSGNTRALHIAITEIRKQISDIRSVGFSGAEAALSSEYLRLAEHEINFTDAAMKSAIRGGLGKEISTYVVPAQSVKNMLAFGAYGGKTLHQWFGKMQEDDLNSIVTTIRGNLSQGKTLDEITKAIIGTPEFKHQDGAINRTRRSAETLARTTTIGVTNAARDEFYKSNSDILAGVEYCAVLDGRTSLICMALDGKKYKVGEAPRPGVDTHPNCRSCIVPVVDGFEDFVADRPSVAGTNFRQAAREAYLEKQIESGLSEKDAREKWNNLSNSRINSLLNEQRREFAGKTIGSEAGGATYSDWLKKQPDDFQNEVLGESRAKAFREGKVTLDKFVDANSNRVYTMDEMRQKEPEIFGKGKKESAKTPPEPLPGTKIDSSGGNPSASFSDGAVFNELPEKLGGSTGAKLVAVDRPDGVSEKYVMKQYNGNEDQAKNEYIANALYNALSKSGAAAPLSKLGLVGGKTAVFNKYVDGATTLDKVSGAQKAAAIAKAQDDFVLDSWLANWDVAGLTMDNVAVDATGKLVRLDNGGALLFRAQGGLKGDSFGSQVGELQTMRDSSKNPSAATLFSGISDKRMVELIDQFDDSFAKIGQAKISSLIESAGFDEKTSLKIKETLLARKDFIKDFGQQLKGKSPAVAEAVVKTANYNTAESYIASKIKKPEKQTKASVKAYNVSLKNFVNTQVYAGYLSPDEADLLLSKKAIGGAAQAIAAKAKTVKKVLSEDVAFPRKQATTKKSAKTYADLEKAVKDKVFYKGSSLTRDELAEIKGFTMGSDPYNDLIRKGMPESEALRTLDAGLDKCPGYSGYAFRGISGENLSDEKWDKWKSGRWGVVQWECYSSTATDEFTALKFSMKAGYERIGYFIKGSGNNGRYVAPISTFRSENEVLYKRNSSFRVVGIMENPSGKMGGDHWFHKVFVMEETDTPEKFLKQDAPKVYDPEGLKALMKANSKTSSTLERMIDGDTIQLEDLK